MLGEKLLVKMWKTIADEGIGSLLSPWQIKREGRAHIDVRRDDLLILAQAEIDAKAIREGKKQFLPKLGLVDIKREFDETSTISFPTQIEISGEIDKLSESMKNTKLSREIQEEININKTIIYAEDELKNDSQEPPEEEIDSDWFTRWQDNAKKVKAEELQKLWAKTLAGEVKSPGTYSLRTLDFIKNISKDEAIMISKVAPFILGKSIYKDDTLEESGIDFSLLLEMEDLTILSGIKGVGLKIEYVSIDKDIFKNHMIGKNKILLIENKDKNKSFSLNCYKVTKLGQEILKHGDFKINKKYIVSIGNKIKKQGFTVKIADYVYIDQEYYNYKNLVEL